MTRQFALGARAGALALGALALILIGPSEAPAHEGPHEWARTDTLEFEIQSSDEYEDREGRDDDYDYHYHDADRVLRVPIGDNLLTDPASWRYNYYEDFRGTLVGDYNRVDRVRLGLGFQSQTGRLNPRIGFRFAYSFGRKRGLYGFQLEQPLFPPGRIALGVSAIRKTDHNELQQVEDLENTLAMLFARTDYRDYFEREGFGAYLTWRIPDFTNLSVHLRKDEYRSVPVHYGTRSFFNRDRDLRPNPQIDDGEARTLVYRMEGTASDGYRTRAGIYHWIDFERADHGLGGDFQYTRLLADVRTLLRLSPATTITLRAVGGSTLDGTLPRQKQFAVGGVDGLRGRAFRSFEGNQVALAQAEYTASLWGVHSGVFEGGLHALAFIDAGHAWTKDGVWNLDKQRIAIDAGFGFSTSSDNLRIYFAKNVQDADSDVVVSVRLKKPF